MDQAKTAQCKFLEFVSHSAALDSELLDADGRPHGNLDRISHFHGEIAAALLKTVVGRCKAIRKQNFRSTLLRPSLKKKHEAGNRSPALLAPTYRRSRQELTAKLPARCNSAQDRVPCARSITNEMATP